MVDPGCWWGWRPLVQFAARGTTIHLANVLRSAGWVPCNSIQTNLGLWWPSHLLFIFSSPLRLFASRLHFSVASRLIACSRVDGPRFDRQSYYLPITAGICYFGIEF